MAAYRVLSRRKRWRRSGHRSSGCSIYSHVHLVRKPTGKWRFYIDFRAINDLCGNIGWPIPNIAETLERIGSKKPKVFVKFDMTSGYFQMTFDPSIRDATSFIYPGGEYRWKRIPMGWKSAGAPFQQQLASPKRAPVQGMRAVYG
jgi:hypothetical protein